MANIITGGRDEYMALAIVRNVYRTGRSVTDVAPNASQRILDRARAILDGADASTALVDGE